MIARIWSGESPVWRLLLLSALWPGERADRLSYRLGLKKAASTGSGGGGGNLTAGGNGKTPVVIWLVEQLQQRGIRVGVVSRGYGGKAASYPLLLSNDTSTAEAGDEPVLIFNAPARRLRSHQSVVRRYRRCFMYMICSSSSPMMACSTKLARDKEIVVIDGERRFGNGWWLPAGPMRERASRLRSVDAIIVNGGVAQAGSHATRTGGEFTAANGVTWLLSRMSLPWPGSAIPLSPRWKAAASCR